MTVIQAVNPRPIFDFTRSILPMMEIVYIFGIQYSLNSGILTLYKIHTHNNIIEMMLLGNQT
jgi:hypothetical protein